MLRPENWSEKGRILTEGCQDEESSEKDDFCVFDENLRPQRETLAHCNLGNILEFSAHVKII